MSAGTLIVGGGLAGQRCAEALRRGGYDGAIRVLSAERQAPYDRPPLSKGVLAGDVEPASLRFRDVAWYRENDVELLLGRSADRLSPRDRTVFSGDTGLRYEHLVIATGSEARTLPLLEDRDNVGVLRTLDDALRLRDWLEPGARLAIVGAGFVGQEVAATARARGVEVALIDAAPAPLVGVLGLELGAWLARMHREEGVELHLGAGIEQARGDRTVTSLVLGGGAEVRCDRVLVAIGARPALDWVAGSGLDAEGLVVDEGGRTAVPGVLAAGDVARVAGHGRSEHWEAAARLAAATARSILGQAPAALPMPSFWSDQYGTRVQFLGDATHADGLRIDGDPFSRDFLATFECDGRPVAAFLAGRPQELPHIRRLLAQAAPRTLPEAA